MNPAQLGALFTQHRTAALGVAAAGVIGLGLRAKRKGSGPAAAPSSSPAGTIPAAAVVPAGSTAATGGGTYDSSAYDVYAALQSELSPFLQSQAAQTSAGGSGINSAPPLVASGLFAPTFSGKYAGYADGSVQEIETDGSLYHLSLPEWSQVISRNGGTAPALVQAPGNAPSDYSNVANTLASIKS